MTEKEKLEEAKRLYQTANADQRYVLESLFPELKESEDEKIRKALLEMIHDTTGDSLWVDYDVHKEEALAWLEKQGGQREQLINKACELLVNCIEDFMLRRIEIWDEECKKQTLENIRKKLEE